MIDREHDLPIARQANRRCSKTLAEKPKAEQIPITVPAIIDMAAFEAVQATLEAHNPRTTPARVVTGPILLKGLAACTTCKGPMTLRTGTSKLRPKRACANE